MTAVRPEQGGAAWDSGTDDPYAAPGAYEAAVGALDDPLNDPLPGPYSQETEAASAAQYDPYPAPPYTGPGAPQQPGPAPAAAPDPYPDPLTAPHEQPYEQLYGTPHEQPYGEAGHPSEPYGPAGAPTPRAEPEPEQHIPAPDPVGHDPETLALLRPPDLTDSAKAGAPPAPAPAEGGRAARRRAAEAARKAREGTLGNKVANVAGELMITTGVLLMLFVTYQLWWTNVEARAHVENEASSLLDRWEGNESSAAEEGEDREPEAFAPGEGFAILYIPTLDVRVPIAEGVDEAAVLDRGLVGRYSAEDGLPTARPWDDEGNVGLAGHRNTHGEPFRYINRLDPGDPIIVETETTYYTYEMRSRLDSTSPSNIAVLDPVPEQGGFTEAGRFITLTTCTPEFTSTYRLIVWGEMVEERPRDEGKPDALVG
ncbi:class E sortase [Streptomyces sp. ACA25]|uniref:class E sortase n=1 Tax=Streptomyces sp. ACA25 TaxID=3022596 RepID=UPI002307BF80|nr:class E sortase [Streptomyces sp. ACA25]MDB1086274.1 class E sortase [Streptomyces sp. ACA25]